ncbi:MAG TPA: efflux RND transporter periplasmic adaptor subunit [Acetobacteraceae bacterium]|nr:efflux RND transporter periplasmic adaptor subunit [Acetobacteraceae bacterium]
MISRTSSRGKADGDQASDPPPENWRFVGAMILALIVLLVASVGSRAEEPPIEAPPVPVTATHAARRNVPVYLLGLGQVKALNTIVIKAQVGGILEETPFTEGQEVKAGDVLAIIDPRPYQAVLDQALAKQAEDQAALANAKADLARYMALVQHNFASQQQVDTQRALVLGLTATLRADDAAIEQARLNLEFTRITAPIAGRLGLRAVDPGNLIAANAPTGIVTLTQMKPISVVFTLPEKDITPVREAAAKGPLTVLAESEGENPRLLDRGTLATISNMVDPSTGTIEMKAIFPNKDEGLWPDEFVNARLLVRTLRNVLTLPVRAVQHGPDGLYVYLIRPDRTVIRKTVTETLEAGGTAVIASGLEDGAEVVLDGQSRLDNGMRVSVEAGS